MRRLPDSVERTIETLRDRLPADRKERTKLLVAGPIAALCLVWLLFWSITHLSFSGPTRAPSSAAFRTADEITRKLIERQEFDDVGMHVVSEKPLKFAVSGAVHSDESLESLRTLMQELRPQNDYEFDIVVIP